MLSKTYAKYIQSLHHKKFRDADNVFIAEGSKVVMELLQSPVFSCQQVLGLQPWMQENEMLIRASYNGPLQVIDDFELEKISALTTPNQVLAVFKKSKQLLVNPKGKISLVLDTIQDPGNLGTIIRIADWFGVGAIICSDNCTDMYNPKVVQSTMGSLGRVNVVYTNISEWLKKNEHIKIYAAALNGKKISQLKGITEAIIVIGNESKGISDEVMELCTEKITIPKVGHAESLNAAVATGIILSHIVQ
ncbi:MAG: methyltransferase [Ferruginibacter sp.]|uniref:TrmH family RNA methyltransferase n=1 Tax=Ferruginibacter sp. TaxID=1940288 RepID=UPI00265B421B|nr:RNA methyltransferase [Ferruginibacter sp.]MDB5278202.1 methyltransferase [Ferruginibacter sp.]